MTYRLHHIHLLCSDLEKTLSFFTEVLGAVLVERKQFGGANGASLDLNGAPINLRVAREDEKISTDPSKTHYGFHHIGFTVDDIDKTYRELSEKGYVFSAAPRDAGKARIAFFSGPDNIVIELLQPFA